LASQAKELDSLDYTLSVIDGNLRAACELDGELLKLNHNVMDLLNYATEVLREGLHSPNEETRLKTAMHVTSRFNLKTVHASVEKTKQVQIALRKEMVERKEQALAKLATPQNPKTILPAPLTPEQAANPPRHPSRLEDFSPLAKPLLQMLPSVIQHNVYNDKIPMPDLQTLQQHWHTWGYTTFRYDADYRGEIRKNGKKLGALYRTTRHNETRYVLKLPASHPLPSGEGRVRDSQKTPINARPSPAAPAAASPEGRGDDAPLVNITTVGAIHESPATLKTTKATKAKATFVQPSPSPLPKTEGVNDDDDVPPEVLAHVQAKLLHLLQHLDPTELQARLSPEHWQLANTLLSAKQERAG
jgi:hypothetical protein